MDNAEAKIYNLNLLENVIGTKTPAKVAKGEEETQ